MVSPPVTARSSRPATGCTVNRDPLPGPPLKGEGESTRKLYRILIRMVTMEIPEGALVVLIGPAGSGKSTFARRHFRATEIVMSDQCRALVADDENDQVATDAAFEVLHLIAAKRLEAGRLTVIDATNVQPESRRPLIDLAQMHHRPAVAVVFDLPVNLCVERNILRVDRTIVREVIRRQRDWLHRSLPFLGHEGFQSVHILSSEEAVNGAAVERRQAAVDSE